MDTINDEDVMLNKKKPAARKPKSGKSATLQKTENTEQPASIPQDEQPIKRTTSRVRLKTAKPEQIAEPEDKAPVKPRTIRARTKTVKPEQKASTPSQEDQPTKPNTCTPRTNKLKPEQVASTPQNEDEPQTKKVVDAIVVCI